MGELSAVRVKHVCCDTGKPITLNRHLLLILQVKIKDDLDVFQVAMAFTGTAPERKLFHLPTDMGKPNKRRRREKSNMQNFYCYAEVNLGEKG